MIYINCPYCKNKDTKVIDSRPSDDNQAIRRRRECEECGKRFTTYERLESVPMMVIKKDGTIEEFDRQKVLNGLLRACNKRPITVAQIDEVVSEIESKIFKDYNKEVSSSILGELMMNHLKKIDEVAYVRFASVYKQFKDVDSFVDELTDLLKQKRKGE